MNETFAEELPLPEAVEKAVDDCIKNGILSDFLAKNRAEAIAVSIFEYDEEKHMRSERKEWHEIGYREGREVGIIAGREEGISVGREEGISIGREEGLNAGFDILKTMMDNGKTDEVKRALSDSDYREQLCREYLSESE